MGLHLGAVKPWVANAAEQIQAAFGISDIGGWRSKGSVPDSDHPKGLALDVMVKHADKDRAQGDKVAAWAQDNAKALGLTYVIWDRHIWSVARAGEGWRNYSGPVPHTDHVHLSFGAQAPAGGTVQIVQSTIKTAGSKLRELLWGPVDTAVDTAQAVGKVGQLITNLSLPSMQLRIWSGVGGALLMVIGLVVLTREATR